ncbi:hypothetical protein F2Q68_00027967 [Brassica cretica]|uniref:RNase H type-1 domain-containing protein n=2 Tax=Brassica cretica TaxID=69181 RepID=A0A8S9IAH8_BRACR|nr:hypothetical protein F2Q68_00027967 [Brassica cretica]
MAQAIRSMREWEQAQPRPQNPATGISPASEARYGSLPSSTIICNTDASWKSQSAGLTWIFTNQEGSEVASKGISLHHVSSPCMAEALAIRGALLNAASLGYHNICLRSDSQELIRAINGRKWTIELHGVLSDIDSLVFSASSTFTFCRFEFTPRSSNGPADRLAKAHLSLY